MAMVIIGEQPQLSFGNENMIFYPGAILEALVYSSMASHEIIDFYGMKSLSNNIGSCSDSDSNVPDRV